MFPCLDCGKPLARAASDGGSFWSCSSCGGRTASILQLRRIASPQVAAELWTSAHEGRGEHKRPCVQCKKFMLSVSTANLADPQSVEICTRCQIAWLRPELCRQLASAPSPVPPQLSPSARQALALLEVEMIVDAVKTEKVDDRTAFTPPGKGWRMAFSFRACRSRRASPRSGQFRGRRTM